MTVSLPAVPCRYCHVPSEKSGIVQLDLAERLRLIGSRVQQETAMKALPADFRKLAAEEPPPAPPPEYFDPERMLTTREAMALLGISRSFLHTLVKCGSIDQMRFAK